VAGYELTCMPRYDFTWYELIWVRLDHGTQYYIEILGRNGATDRYGFMDR